MVIVIVIINEVVVVVIKSATTCSEAGRCMGCICICIINPGVFNIVSINKIKINLIIRSSDLN